MVQRMQFPFSLRLSFARSSYCKSHLEMRTLDFLFKIYLANYLQSAKRISCRRMSPLVCRLVTHIPTRQLLKFTSCTDSPICCQWLLTLLRPTVCRKLERGRYLLEHSINISSPTWLHWRDSFWRSRRSSKQCVCPEIIASRNELFLRLCEFLFLKFPVRIFLNPLAILKSRKDSQNPTLIFKL